ncbi:MAG: hypothetical protein WD928_05760 [Gammaproteobacteria bacterium]
MQRKLLSIAVGAALGTLGVNAQAVEFGPLEGDATYYFSGATASAQFVRNSLIDRACDPAGGLSGKEITVYQKDGDDYVVICDLLPAVGTSTIRAIKQGGGSGDGTTPVSQPALSPLQYPVPTAAFNPATACAAPVNTQTGAGTPFVFYNNCDIPNITVNGGDIGTSDVEPKLFFDVNTPSTGIAWTPADTEKVDVKPLAGLAFGLPATKGLRDALQALQFPTTSACHPTHPAWDDVLPTSADVAGDGTMVALDVARIDAGSKNPTADVSPALGTATVADSAECMPNMAKAETTGILTGRLRTWTQIQRNGTNLVAAATAAGLPVPSFSANPALNNQRTHVCRRNDGSGTQAQYNAFYLSRPCMSIGGVITAEEPVSAGSSNCTYLGASVVCNNRGSSDVDRCLDDLENSTNVSGRFGGTGPFGPRYAWGIGVQSTEKNADLGRGYRFVRTDGVVPKIDSVWAADYYDHYEQTCQIRKDNSTIDPAADGPTARAIFDTVCTAGLVDVFEANQNFLHAWGIGGWLTVPDGPGGSVADAPLTAAGLMDPDNPVPVSSWTYRGESCSAPVVFDPVQSTMESDID